MAETAARGRERSLARQTAPRPDATPDPGPAGGAPGAPGVGSRSLRVPRRRVDGETGRDSDRTGVWVRYHPDHVGRLLRAVGWSVQKPVTRATQRDEAAIQAWCEQRWPEV